MKISKKDSTNKKFNALQQFKSLVDQSNSYWVTFQYSSLDFLNTQMTSKNTMEKLVGA